MLSEYTYLIKWILGGVTLVGVGITLWEKFGKYFIDLKRLKEWSTTEISAHEAQGKTKLTIGKHQLSISRSISAIVCVNGRVVCGI